MKISVARYRATDSLKNSLKRRLVTSRSIIPILFAVSLILLACLHVWQRVYVMGLVQEVSTLRATNNKLGDLIKKKSLKNIDLSRLSRIEKLAYDNFKMATTTAGNSFTLTAGNRRVNNSGLDEMVESMKKLADNLPVLTESNAETSDIFENYEEK
jgi:cell division protein FtsL